LHLKPRPICAPDILVSLAEPEPKDHPEEALNDTAHHRKATEALARAANRGSLASNALGKRTFYETIDLDLEAAYARAMEVMAESALTPDGCESFRAFLEKRPRTYPPTR
jgi:enoyl-CoA hydratase/carnithine racemase